MPAPLLFSRQIKEIRLQSHGPRDCSMTPWQLLAASEKKVGKRLFEVVGSRCKINSKENTEPKISL